MLKLPLSGLLGGDGTVLVGEAAKLEFKFRYVPEQPQGARPLSQVLNSGEFARSAQESMQKWVQKKFGKHYFVDKLEIDSANHTVTASISTLLDDDVSLKSIAKKTAAAARGMRDDLLAVARESAGAEPWIQVSWSQGEGLFDSVALLSPDTPSPQLEARLAVLKRKRQRFNGWRLICLIVSAVFISLVLADPNKDTLFLSIFYGVLGVGIALVFTSKIADLNSEARDLSTVLDLRKLDVADRKSRAEKLFREHSFELKRYYDQTLSQGRTIYLVGLGCLLLGFAVIGVSLWLVLEGESEEKVIVGVLGAIAGVLADYVAVVYLKMFSQTVQAVTGFHRRFVMTHHLHLGNMLASTIESQELREKTLAAMAEALAASGTPSAELEASENGKSPAGGKVLS